VTSPQYHTLSHEGAAAATQKTEIDTWWYTQVATLLAALDGSTEGPATSLDNSVVLVCNDMQEGNTHLSAGIPFVMAGSGGGFFNTGRFVGFNGVSNNQLLTSILHAMGLTTITGVGRAAYTGDLDSELT
jgi:hypothetical protein